MAVCFNRFSGSVGLVHMIGKAPRVNRPAVAFGFALNNHLSQQSTSATSLNYTKGKDTSFKRIWHTRHRPNQGQPVRSIRNRPVNHPRDAGRAQKWHSCTSIFDIPFKPFQIVVIKLERKIVRHWITGINPMGPAIFLVRAQQ